MSGDVVQQQGGVSGSENSEGQQRAGVIYSDELCLYDWPMLDVVYGYVKYICSK